MSKEYRIVTASDIKTLEELVVTYLEAGWYCQGGVCVHIDPHELTNYSFYQAMRYDNK